MTKEKIIEEAMWDAKKKGTVTFMPAHPPNVPKPTITLDVDQLEVVLQSALDAQKKEIVEELKELGKLIGCPCEPEEGMEDCFVCRVDALIHKLEEKYDLQIM